MQDRLDVGCCRGVDKSLSGRANAAHAGASCEGLRMAGRCCCHCVRFRSRCSLELNCSMHEVGESGEDFEDARFVEVGVFGVV